MDKKTFTSSLPEDTLKVLKILAIREDITFSDLLTKIVDQYLETYGELVTPYERRMGATNEDHNYND